MFIASNGICPSVIEREYAVMRRIQNWLQVLLARARRLPQTWREARKQRLRQKVLARGEIERLDRIRHPWKYRGK
jgi:hypothetical protein